MLPVLYCAPFPLRVTRAESTIIGIKSPFTNYSVKTFGNLRFLLFISLIINSLTSAAR